MKISTQKLWEGLFSFLEQKMIIKYRNKMKRLPMNKNYQKKKRIKLKHKKHKLKLKPRKMNSKRR